MFRPDRRRSDDRSAGLRLLTGLLAPIGVYGLLAWTVDEQRREPAKASHLARGRDAITTLTV
jgi:hypothetical protein